MFSYSYGGWKSSARQNKTTGAILVKACLIVETEFFQILPISPLQVHVWILKHVVKVGSDSFNSSPSVATMGDKVHNPVDQLTAIHEQSGVHSHTATSNDTNNHLQVGCGSSCV